MKIAGGAIAGILIAVLTMLATRIALSADRARQEALFAAWGGTPTPAMLRYSDARLNPRQGEFSGAPNSLGYQLPDT
jgi:hypothetical protein